MFCFYLSVIMIYCTYREPLFESGDVGNGAIYGGGGGGGCCANRHQNATPKGGA